ncbi:MAG: hypothetical protein AMJ65_09950 [Phycisphaerae bacterium SG8_4]|nr:MAG: hypothetical protein AMJ65_09950 [Phycisphaerae bacterium SG8_4]
MTQSEFTDSRRCKNVTQFVLLRESMPGKWSILIALSLAVSSFAVAQSVSQYDVVWEAPSEDSSGSMPIGNGDIGLNLWVDPAGELVFYISKTDSWSENARLLKLGLVRVKMSPGLWEQGMVFRQKLNLGGGQIEITAGEGERERRLRVWVDANRPVIFVEARGERPFDLEAKLQIWRTHERRIKGAEAVSARGLTGNDKNDYPIIVYPDTIATGRADSVVWYHRNEKSCYPVTLKNQHLGGLLQKYPDPLMHRTFGGSMLGEGLRAVDGVTLKSQETRNRFVLEIHPLTAQTKTGDEWLELLEKQVERVDSQDFELARAEHRRWWESFWDRSWIHVSGSKAGDEAHVVSRGYALQRWINACGGRGGYPIKFNGSIFTVDAQVGDEHFDGDYRRWGAMYWWQNTRLPYWSMLAAGDFDLMGPLFAMYSSALDLCKDKTTIYYQHKGAFFPETMYFWGTNGNCDYGWGHPGPETINQYIRREWQGGIEITAMMLDYHAMKQDEQFLSETVLPIAEEVLTFYDEHWDRDADGKIRFEPAQALETWWQCVNPTPEVAGLRHVLQRLLALEEGVRRSQVAAWRRMLRDLPPMPVTDEDGKRFVLPAEKFDVLRNSENPELYAVFPYRLYGLAFGNLEVGLETWRRRRVKESVGWRQDSIQAAYLGLADEAAKYVSGNFSTWHKASRFPAFWGPNFDWVPDQDHGSVAMIALQRMALQDNGGQIILLPAWPKNWDVAFKLHAGMNTTVECEVRGGKVLKLEVRPGSRRSDVKLGSQWQ